jgi:hypothetical protein
MVNTGRSKLLDSFFFENQVWGALHKAWKGYVIAKNKGEDDKKGALCTYYSRVSQLSLKHQLHYEINKQ